MMDANPSFAKRVGLWLIWTLFWIVALRNIPNSPTGSVDEI